MTSFCEGSSGDLVKRRLFSKASIVSVICMLFDVFHRVGLCYSYGLISSCVDRYIVLCNRVHSPFIDSPVQ